MSLLEAINISKHYQRGTEIVKAVDGISLSINDGEFVSFVGASGSGKTTLLHMLGCLDTPSFGSLSIAGNTVFDGKKSQSEKLLTKLRGDNFGYIFQKFYLIPTLTVKENILLPFAFSNKHEASSNVEAVAKELGLSHRLNHLPKEISGGEMQRVAIARALINKPRIILADEPTGNLDSTRSNEISDILKDLNQQHGITIILVTHNQALAKLAKRSIELADGKLIG